MDHEAVDAVFDIARGFSGSEVAQNRLVPTCQITMSGLASDNRLAELIISGASSPPCQRLTTVMFDRSGYWRRNWAARRLR